MASTDTHTNTNNLALAASRLAGGRGSGSGGTGDGGDASGGGPSSRGCHYQLHESTRQHDVDFTEEKVGLATRPLEARDCYATCERGPEPYSTVKAQNQQAGVECDMCRCAPCQLTALEQKRSGKPSLHTPHKAVTGTNAHPAHDYKNVGGHEIDPALLCDRSATAKTGTHFLG
eukprot:XP_001694254.1 predicted protein [Chlamydomonas reinhardtii]